MSFFAPILGGLGRLATFVMGSPVIKHALVGAVVGGISGTIDKFRHSDPKPQPAPAAPAPVESREVVPYKENQYIKSGVRSAADYASKQLQPYGALPQNVIGSMYKTWQGRPISNFNPNLKYWGDQTYITRYDESKENEDDMEPKVTKKQKNGKDVRRTKFVYDDNL